MLALHRNAMGYICARVISLLGLPQLDDVAGEAFCSSKRGTASSSLSFGVSFALLDLISGHIGAGQKLMQEEAGRCRLRCKCCCLFAGVQF